MIVYETTSLMWTMSEATPLIRLPEPTTPPHTTSLTTGGNMAGRTGAVVELTVMMRERETETESK